MSGRSIAANRPRRQARAHVVARPLAGMVTAARLLFASDTGPAFAFVITLLVNNAGDGKAALVEALGARCADWPDTRIQIRSDKSERRR